MPEYEPESRLSAISFPKKKNSYGLEDFIAMGIGYGTLGALIGTYYAISEAIKYIIN